MHPLIPYLLGQKHPLGKRLTSVQKCIRTTDIEEVGDTSHHTFIEMLGNWSLGDYWKKEVIEMSFEFLTSKKWLGLDKDRIAISVFSGDKNAPKDIESRKIWKNLKIPEERIINLKEDNWWGPAGETGPCGPSTEMFYWSEKTKPRKRFNPNDSTLATEGHGWVEIWNDVFMEYNKTEKEKYEPLKQKNVDTGMGVERTLAVLNGLDDDYMTETFLPIIKTIEKLSKKKYKDSGPWMRIIADHVKASVFIIADGILPSNTGQGYVLRRLIRRSVRGGKKIGIESSFIYTVAIPVFEIYSDYKELKENKKKILKILKEEENKFYKTIGKGLQEFERISKNKKIGDEISGKEAFLLFQSYGFPKEITWELAAEKGLNLDASGFNKELAKHQKLSQKASSGSFKSGLADQSKKTTKLHTATHLLNEALRKVLDKNIRQRGSNITSERLRFDFNFPRKLTEKEIKKVEDLVNKKISQGLKVISEEMPLKKAIASGIQSEFNAKYPDIVRVYSVGNFSKEICAGPHVKNTNEIGKFKIKKEESSAAGIRRIKAILE